MRKRVENPLKPPMVKQKGKCLVWLGYCNGDYGQVSYHGRNIYVHRLAFMMTNGREPSGQIKHTCGNVLCVNPEHLTDSPARQLPQAEKARIFEMYTVQGMSGRTIAKELNICRTKVYDIIKEMKSDEAT